MYRDFSPNFLVSSTERISKEIADDGYGKNNIVYSHSTQVLKYPENFHLIPNDQYWDAGSTATWLACFDGMKTIYLLGFDQMDGIHPVYNVYVDTTGYPTSSDRSNDEVWINNMYNIFTTYNDVDFVWVNPTTMPEQWRYASNLRQVDINGFARESDLGA